MKIAITGADGLVGNEFVRQLSPHHNVLAFAHRDLDITESETVTRVILDESPALIVNCAVVGVDACERDPELAWSVNVSAAENLARAARAVEADLVQFSSNYVFDGEADRNSFLTIADTPAPNNIYGQTKLAAEWAVTAASYRYFIVRTSWIFGAGKESFFSTVPRSLNAAKKIRAITDVWASATYVRDLVQRVMEIVAHGHCATYHVVNSGLCSYHEFAVKVARVLKIPDSRLTELIEPIKLGDLGLPAKRPCYTPLSCSVSEEIGLSPLRDWREAVAEYVRALGLSRC
jgi:dTDP-4-dehydrorhamnose reductase